VAMDEPATATHDTKIQELKDTYYEMFEHPPRGRYASDCAWLTSKIALGCRQQSALPSAAVVVPPEAPVISTLALTPDVIMPRFGQMVSVGLAMIQVSDYVFEAGDKGMTFGASTVNSVHIKTIASEGMAARLFGQELRVGCMLINIEGRQIIGEPNALEIAQAHELHGCVLTISVPPEDNITWMTDNIEVTRPSMGSEQKILESEPAEDHVHTSKDINRPNELKAHVAPTNDFGRTTTNFVVQSHHPKTGDYSIHATKAVPSRDSTVISMSDSCDISETSTIQDNAHSKAITETFGDDGVDPSADDRILDYQISMNNLCTFMFDSDGHRMG
jgi:hypothetical protein